MCPLQGRGCDMGNPFTQGQAPVLGYDALSRQKASLIIDF